MTHIFSTLVEQGKTWGFYRTQSKPNQPARWAIACDDCKVETSLSLEPSMPTHILVKKLTKKGWALAEHRPPVCPACAARRTAAKVISILNDWGDNAPTKKEDTTMARQSVGPDPKIARKVYGLLEGNFDDSRRRYHTGWSDDRVAREADTSPELVARIRCDAYGELAEDPAIQGLRDDLELLRMEIMESTARHQTWVASCLEKIGQLEARINDHKIRKAI